ncbi:hypothetical protein DFH05DRAFT_960973 [Lentinula detonsa]|uniref:Uncharacterized protein n=1 Tax=Lentinula detonsa TaxID=2804962 RepID=A0A9W8TZC4_9AGAR|nr:hypothetical protein DFH05DRAFT_960973 [Lentinula detonsa]
MNNNMNNMAMSGMGINNIGGGLPMGGGGMGMNGALGGMGGINPVNLGMNSMGGGGMGMNMGVGSIGGNMGPSRAGGGINPSQLINLGAGSGGMGLAGGSGVNSMNSMGGMGGLNPTQLLQSQHQRDRDQMSAMQQQRGGGGSNMGVGGGGYGMNSMNGMNGMNNMNIGNNFGSMNPSAMSSSPTASSTMGMSMMGGEPAQRHGANMSMNNSGMGGMPSTMGSQNHFNSQHSSNSMHLHPSSSNMSHSNSNLPPSSGGGPNIHPQMLHSMGISPEKFQAMSPQEKAMVAQKMAFAFRNSANANNHAQHNSTSSPSSGTPGMHGQGNIPGSGMGYFDREGLQLRDQGRAFGEQQRAAAMHGRSGTPGMDPPARPGSSAEFGGLAGDIISMGGNMGNMMPPPPRPSTAMSNRSAPGMGRSFIRLLGSLLTRLFIITSQVYPIRRRWA